MDYSEKACLIVYSHNDSIEMTILIMTDNQTGSIDDIFRMIINTIIQKGHNVNLALCSIINHFYSKDTPEICLSPKMSDYLRKTFDDSKIFIDDGKDCIRLSNKNTTIKYIIDGYHNDNV